MCPHCGQNAPIVYRGVAAFCSACGKPRTPLITPSVSYAGKPSKVGGTVAGVFGWIVLVLGTSAAIGLGLLASLFSSTLALAVALPIGLVTLAVTISLLFSSRKLRQSGESTEKETRRKAVFALARNRGGTITANDAAAALDISAADADAFLTTLAKTESDEVTLEIDDKGGIYYAFPRISAGAGRSRIGGIGSDDPRVRVTGVPDTFESEGLDYEEPSARQRRQRR